MSVDIKLRRKFDPAVPGIANNKITAKITGTVGQSFLEIKIPIESVDHSTGSNSNHRSFSELPKDLKILVNQFFVSPVVIDAVPSNNVDNTSNIQIDVSLVVSGKKPWEGAL